jgi:two-component system, OmpR family, sensor histidine kinase KdpD
MLAFGGPTIATSTALLVGSDHQVVATSAYLLAVVVAAAFGGRAAGLAAALLSFLGLNFFFTEPRYTFRVDKGEDLVALVLFLVVATIVGTLLAIALRDRLQSCRRERETAIASFVGVQLLAGLPLEIVLWRFAETLTTSLDLVRCEIDAAVGKRTFEAEADGEGRPGERVASPLTVRERVFGSLTVVRRDGAHPLDDDEARLLRAAAEQIAVALEHVELEGALRARESEIPELRGPSLSSLTHDLRTPLASIEVAVSTVLDADASLDDGRRRELLEDVLAEARRLHRLVDDVMELARVRSGRLDPAVESVSVGNVIDGTVQRLHATLDLYRVRTVIRPDLPLVAADPARLEQALANLLENAARFSPAGGEIVITASRWHDVVRIGVADQGPGILPEDRERVFDAFYRRDAGAGRAGSGLGLAVVRAIAVAYGGSATVEASPTGGAAVTVELPASRVEQPVA